LVAEDRSFGHGPQPLLFEVLDAMDGLDTDADVAFLLTTNRVELLEEALVQRPGRVDLAVAVPRPDTVARRALLELYGSRLNPSARTIKDIAGQIEGTTASFAKELTRRAILLAALAGEEPSDAHLSAAATELMSDAASLTRSLLGGTGENGSEPDPESSQGYFGAGPGIAPEAPGTMGWS
ncbi:MAG: ATP-binding protein, partial [Paeniglutamicibacter sp.]